MLEGLFKALMAGAAGAGAAPRALRAPGPSRRCTGPGPASGGAAGLRGAPVPSFSSLVPCFPSLVPCFPSLAPFPLSFFPCSLFLAPFPLPHSPAPQGRRRPQARPPEGEGAGIPPGRLGALRLWRADKGINLLWRDEKGLNLLGYRIEAGRAIPPPSPAPPRSCPRPVKAAPLERNQLQVLHVFI